MVWSAHKVPRIPLVVVRDDRSWSLLQHFTHQYHPMQQRPEFRHLQAHLDEPLVEQVECLVQLQHCST